MDADVRDRVLIARLALAGSALMLVILAMSATIRLAHDACAAAAVPAAVVNVARMVHRISAMSVSVVLMLLTLLSLRSRPVPRRRVAQLAALFLLTLFLAVLGRAGAGSSVPAIPLFNVVAGMAMLALFWSVRTDTAKRSIFAEARPGATRLAQVAAALVMLEAALGASIAGLTASLGCTAAAGKLVVWPDSAAWRALDLLHAPTAPAAAVADALGWLLLLHQIDAALLFVVAAALALRWQRREKKFGGAGSALLILLTSQVALGVAHAGAGAALWLGVAHNALAALLLAVLWSAALARA